MQTILLETPGRFLLTDTPWPSAPGPGEALLAVRRIGICGTDLHAFRGRQPFFTYPRILGHELGVEVLDVGPGVLGVEPGDRCAVEPYLNCGHCIACRRGRPNCCVHLQTLGVHTDGGMRERIVLPASKLHPSHTLSFDQLALIETLGIGAHAIARAQPEPGEWVLVLGAGPIGQALIQFALLAGAQVIAMDLNPDRLAFCRAMGVSHTIDGRDDPLGQVRALTSDDLPTVVCDATGNASSMSEAFHFVAHGGRLVFVGLITGDVSFHDPLLHRRELTVLASRNSTPTDFHRILQLVESGQIDTRPWITHRAPFSALIDQFPHWLEPENRVLKAIVEID